MQVALSINARDAVQARDRALRAATILPPAGIIHIDIGDGIYASIVSWGDAAAWRALAPTGIKTEVHLMARDWESRCVPWLEAGAFRIIIQADLADREDARRAREITARYHAELMLSFSLRDDSADVSSYAEFAEFTAFQVLAVPAGRSGQKFDERAIQKIQALRAAFPHAILEVDGGITPVLAARAKEAGADIVVSSSFIWNAESPKEAYELLTRI